MVTTTSLKVGESLSIGLYFNDNYQLPATCNLIVFIGGVCVGNLFTQHPEIDRVGVYYTIRLSSQDTSKMRGYRDLIVILDDPEGFGNKKTIVGGILFDRMADEFITISENQGYNILIGMTVNESVISGDINLINALKGEDGTPGVGVIPGGSTGQVLAKKSDDDFDTEWVTGCRGGLLTSEQDMDVAIPGKYYAFTLSEQHSEIAASNGSLFVMNSDEADGVIQVATIVIEGETKQYARHGAISAYSPFEEISGGGEVPVFPENTITSVSLAQLPAGSNISGKNALEVLDLAINAELFPTLTAPSYTFTIEPSGLQEVGSTHFMGFTRTFNRGSITPQYQSESPYRAGTLIDYTETGHFGIEEYQILLGANTWASRANYNAGVQPKGSKGANYQSPLAAGSTAIVTRTITGVYPVYATTTNISIYTKLGLLEHGADIEVNEMVAETAGAKQSIRIPQAWGTITSLQQFNTLSGQWDNIDLSTFTKTAVLLTINGSTVNYWEYTHNGATIGSRRLKFRL